MRERFIRVRGARYRLEVRDDEDVAVVVLAFTADGALAGKARAVRLRHEPAAADVRLTVDTSAHRGLDARLLDALRAEARAAGIDRLTGRVVLDDTRAQRLLVARGAACWLADSDLIASGAEPSGETTQEHSAMGWTAAASRWTRQSMHFELPASRRARTVPPVVAQRRQFGRLAS